MPRKQLNSVLDAELGQDWSSKLTSFDYEPLAAASIGQVCLAESSLYYFDETIPNWPYHLTKEEGQIQDFIVLDTWLMQKILNLIGNDYLRS